jgi:predicted heme/steroid binding protein
MVHGAFFICRSQTTRQRRSVACAFRNLTTMSQRKGPWSTMAGGLATTRGLFTSSHGRMNIPFIYTTNQTLLYQCIRGDRVGTGHTTNADSDGMCWHVGNHQSRSSAGSDFVSDPSLELRHHAGVGFLNEYRLSIVMVCATEGCVSLD